MKITKTNMEPCAIGCAGYLIYDRPDSKNRQRIGKEKQ